LNKFQLQDYDFGLFGKSAEWYALNHSLGRGNSALEHKGEAMNFFLGSLFSTLFLLSITGSAQAAAPRLDPIPVSATEFKRFTRSTPTPKSGENATLPNGPAVNLNWHEAKAFCASMGKRLPSAGEWLVACESKAIEFPWWIWEWTSTNANQDEGADFKLLCGPGTTTCECTHAYHTSWSNEVKGFRCVKPEPSVALTTGKTKNKPDLTQAPH
jgi:hypothetical protein